MEKEIKVRKSATGAQVHGHTEPIPFDLSFLNEHMLARAVASYPNKPYTPKRLLVLAHSKGICQLCMRRIESWSCFTIDHIVPRSKGGGSKFSNLQAAHAKCNWFKGDKEGLTVEDFQHIDVRVKIVPYKPSQDVSTVSSQNLTAFEKRSIEELKKAVHVRKKNESLKLKEFTIKPSAGIRKDMPEGFESTGDPCMDLYNEIQRHGTTRLSYKIFKTYFERYNPH